MSPTTTPPDHATPQPDTVQQPHPREPRTDVPPPKLDPSVGDEDAIGLVDPRDATATAPGVLSDIMLGPAGPG
jgi:hypothetical protein